MKKWSHSIIIIHSIVNTKKYKPTRSRVEEPPNQSIDMNNATRIDKKK